MAEEDGVCVDGRQHFVLVHGIGHGAWCWFKVSYLLQQSGHSVTCLDLTSAGIDNTDANDVHAFDQYNRPLIHFLSNLPHNQKVVLVGHSAGGLSVIHAIHTFGASKIRLAVFVCATMLRSGFWTPQDFQDGVPNLQEEMEVIFGEGPENPPTSVSFKPEFQRQILYHESSEEDCVLASMLLKPVPARALQAARFDNSVMNNNHTSVLDEVRRVYIKTSKDRVLKPEQQDALIKRWPPCEVMSLDTDHSPFFSAPTQLASLLLKASNS